MSIKIKEAISAYIGMRNAIAEKQRVVDDYKKDLKDNMGKLELYIHKLLNDLDLTEFKYKGVGTAFIATKDFVSVSDKEGFKKFLSAKLLLALQDYHYKNPDGGWKNDGELDLEEHVERLLNGGVFDLLTISANKNNCKSYMSDNKGIMPDGVDYRTEKVVQFRKG